MSDNLRENSFSSLNINPKILDSLSDQGIQIPTPVQAQTIPHLMQGKDLIGIAQTGTGKTLAYAIPLFEQLIAEASATESEQNRSKSGSIQTLIIAPTRELALQIDDAILKMGRAWGLRTALLVGGAAFHKQIARLRSKPQIVVATPGRLEDLHRQRAVNLNHVQRLILDEADRMLDMGFAPIIRRIATMLPSNRQTMMFSATFPKEIEALAAELLTDPIRIEVSQSGSVAENVSQELMVMQHEDKVHVLEKLLSEREGPVIVFARTRHGARKLAKAIVDMNHFAAEIHADRTLAQRRDAIDGFRSGRYVVLVATDIASRGLDIKDVSMVVNFDLPDQPEDYVHRIGRTARAGKSGRSVTFATPQQKRELFAVEKLLKQVIPMSDHSPLELHRPAAGIRGTHGGESRGPRFGGNGQRGRNSDRMPSPSVSNHDRPRYNPESRPSRSGDNGYGDRPNYRDQGPQQQESRPPRPGYQGNNDQGQFRNQRSQPQDSRQDSRQDRSGQRSEPDNRNSQPDGRRNDERPSYRGQEQYRDNNGYRGKSYSRNSQNDRPDSNRQENNRDGNPSQNNGSAPVDRNSHSGAERTQFNRDPSSRNTEFGQKQTGSRDERYQPRPSSRPSGNRPQSRRYDSRPSGTPIAPAPKSDGGQFSPKRDQPKAVGNSQQRQHATPGNSGNGEKRKFKFTPKKFAKKGQNRTSRPGR